MACTYFADCPACGHAYMIHIGILSGAQNCSHDECTCTQRPPRWYVYDKDPEFIKDALTLQHWGLVESGGGDSSMAMVVRIVDALNATESLVK